jgi:hypothetical protein
MRWGDPRAPGYPEMEKTMRFLAVGAGTMLAAFTWMLIASIWSREAIPQTKSSDREASIAAWALIASVLQHPRCLNCHQPNAPLHGDTPRAHSPRVVRGRDNQGAPGMRCGSCHSERGNNEASRVPGATDWKMPPRSMTWAGLSIGQLCRTLKDRRKNGGRSPRAIIKHMQDDSLVHWSWSPGGTRKSVPVPHYVFVEFVEDWVRTGVHCPD